MEELYHLSCPPLPDAIYCRKRWIMSDDDSFLYQTVISITGPSPSESRRNDRGPREWWEVSAARGTVNHDGRGGRRLERHFQRILEYMRSRGLIAGFTRHVPFSKEDHEGKDFTVTRQTASGLRSYSFGITMSKLSRKRSRKKHQGVMIIYLPPELTGFDVIRTVEACWDALDDDRP
ncbi:MAG: hypothetical protein KGI69_00875 [Patescibacteria group bacterium]|nr:hypothetical protein [Patescibacteria group bacterium]